MLITSFNFNYHIKGPISRYSHMAGSGGRDGGGHLIQSVTTKSASSFKEIASSQGLAHMCVCTCVQSCPTLLQSHGL